MVDSTVCIFHSLFFSIVIGVTIFLCTYQSDFKNPRFFLDQTSVTSINLAPDGHLTGMFGVVIRVENPNHKYKIKYKDIRVKIIKTRQRLAKDKLKNLIKYKIKYKDIRVKGNVTVLRAEPIALNVVLKKGPAFDFGIERGIGYLEYRVLVDGRVDSNYLYVNCLGRVNVSSFSPVSNINAQNFQSAECSVRIYTKYVRDE